jgi:ubiquitin
VTVSIVGARATTMRGNMMSIVTKTIVNIVSVIPTNGSMTRTVIKSTAAKTAIKIIASMTNIAIKITMAEVVMTINGAINQPAMKSTVGITAITIGNTMKIAIRNIAEKIVIKTTTKKNGMQLRMFV